MKLLIITQKVDIDDPILGFFHNWIVKFSKHFESIIVICLEKGKYNLPQNVRVFSLGKENGQSRLKYIFNFYKYIWLERKNYNSVFVHMNQEYIILGALLWKILDKGIYMWRNHGAGNSITDIAISLCDKVFCTSKYSYTAKSKRVVFMPVGIDTDIFKIKGEINKINNSILFLARISPAKKPHILIEALNRLNKDLDFNVAIYGDPIGKDTEYYRSLKDSVSKYNLNQKIVFYKSVPNYMTADIYNKYCIFVNLSSQGMYDKTIFEAMSCGIIPLFCSLTLKDDIGDDYYFKEDDSIVLADKIHYLLSNDRFKSIPVERFREYVVKKHGLDILAYKLIEEINGKK